MVSKFRNRTKEIKDQLYEINEEVLGIYETEIPHKEKFDFTKPKCHSSDLLDVIEHTINNSLEEEEEDNDMIFNLNSPNKKFPKDYEIEFII